MPHSWLSNATAVMFTTKNEKETRTSAPFLCASLDPSGHRFRHHPLRAVLVPLKKYFEPRCSEKRIPLSHASLPVPACVACRLPR